MDQGERQMECLPPGFRFFPTDEELITFYLARKAMDASFTSAAIRDVDLYKSEPWDLPRKAAMTAGSGGDEECYYFCKRGSRYPSGARSRRATAAGYWKSTGKDKGVRCSGGGGLVGTKKTLVFYRGRAPRGEKTSWVMHEYTLLGQRNSGSSSSACSNFPIGAHSQWVICRVFMKKPPSDHTTLEMDLQLEESVHGQKSPSHLRPVMSDGCDGVEAAPPPVLSNDPWDTNSRAVDGDHAKDDMVHHEELSSIMNRPSCASPSWLLYDDGQLGPYCSTLHILQQHSSASDNLPELLDYGGYDLPNYSASRGDGLTTTSKAGHPAEIWPSSVASLHLDEPYWNFGFWKAHI